METAMPTELSDRAASYIRTIWPIFVGHVAALLVTAIAARFGLHIDNAIAFEAVGFAASALIYWAGRNLETSKVPMLQAVGHLILTMGIATTPPTYQAPPSATPTASPK